MEITVPLMLVSYNTSCWNGKKLDRRTSSELDQTKETKARVARVTKDLMADVESLKAINSHIASTRTNFFYKYTAPWDDDGKRALDAGMYMEFNTEAQHREATFYQLVDEFEHDYSNIITAQAFKLGKWFSRADYPDPSEIRKKFAMRFSYTPLPSSGDFRLSAFKEVQDAVVAQHEQLNVERTERIMQDAWERLHAALERIIEQMEPNADGKRRRIYDSLLEQAYELCHLLTGFNVTGDPKLEQARQELERALSGTSTHVLRGSDHARTELRDAAKAIVNKFSL